MRNRIPEQEILKELHAMLENNPGRIYGRIIEVIQKKKKLEEKNLEYLEESLEERNLWEIYEGILIQICMKF